ARCPVNRFHASMAIVVLFSGSVLMGNSCGDGIVKSPYFELWCGDTLCGWSTDSGAIRRVPTWHAADYGVALEGDGARISQLVTERVKCFEFDLLADIAGDTTVLLE